MKPVVPQEGIEAICKKCATGKFNVPFIYLFNYHLSGTLSELGSIPEAGNLGIIPEMWVAASTTAYTCQVPALCF